MNPKEEPVIYLIAICFIGYGIFVGLYFSFAEPGPPGLLLVSVILSGLVGGAVGISSFYWFEIRAQELLEELSADVDEEKYSGEIGSLIRALSDRLHSLSEQKKLASDRKKKNEELQKQLTECRELRLEDRQRFQEIKEKFREANKKMATTLAAIEGGDYGKQIITCLDALEAGEEEISRREDDVIEQLLQRLETRLNDLVSPLDRVQKVNEQLEQLADEMEERSQEFEKLAINTGIEGAKLGEEGGVVSALAEDIQLGAKKTRRLADNLEEERKKLHQLTDFKYNDCFDLIEEMGAEISSAAEASKPPGARLRQLKDLFENLLEQVSINQERIYEVQKSLDNIDHKLAAVISLPAGENYE